MVNDVLFWSVAAITVIPALSLIFARKAVYIAMCMVLVMIGLATAYISLGAPFLGMVQIVVYTGAVMMLFVFVLMLVGVDQRESLRETIKGQRWIGFFFGIGLALLLITAINKVTLSVSTKPITGNPDYVGTLLFGRYVLVIEVLAALLIAAAVGALVLTNTPRLTPRRNQAARLRDRIQKGADPVNKPMPGVYARHNALDVPALDPEGNPIEESVSRVLEARHQMQDGNEFRAGLEKGEK